MPSLFLDQQHRVDIARRIGPADDQSIAGNIDPGCAIRPGAAASPEAAGVDVFCGAPNASGAFAPTRRMQPTISRVPST